MKWSMEIKRRGVMEQTNTGYVQDPFWSLAQQVRDDQANKLPNVTVEAKVAHWGDNISVSFTVSCQCPQAQQHIEFAAKLVYQTATRFVNDAVSRMDSRMPMLPTEP